MSIPDEVMKLLKCCLSTDDHIVRNAVLITACGGNACRECATNFNHNYTNCNYCNRFHNINFNYLPSNVSIDILIKTTFFKELVDNFQSSFNNILKAVQIEAMEEALNNKIELIENDICIRVESLKMQLEQMEKSFRKELVHMKEKVKNFFHGDEVTKLREEIEALHKETKFEINQENFYEIQSKLIKFQNNLKHLKDKTLIKFENSSTELNDFNLIGILSSDLQQPFEESIPYLLHLKCQQSIEVQSQNSLENLNNRLKITDNIKAKKIFQEISLYYDYKRLKRLFSACGLFNKMIHNLKIYTSKSDELFLTAQNLNKIIVVDLNLKIKREFGKDVIKDADYLAINETDISSNTKNFYVSDSKNNIITVWNSETGEYVKTIDIDSPGHIKFNTDKMYVVSVTTLNEKYRHTDIAKDHNVIDKISNGSNCIYILNSTTHVKIHELRLDGWCSPSSLYVDSKNRLLTVAYHTDSFYLIAFDEDMQNVAKIKLKSFAGPSYLKEIYAIQRKIIFLQTYEIDMYEFF